MSHRYAPRPTGKERIQRQLLRMGQDVPLSEIGYVHLSRNVQGWWVGERYLGRTIEDALLTLRIEEASKQRESDELRLTPS